MFATCIHAGGGHFEHMLQQKRMRCDTCDFFLDKIVANRQKNFADCVMVKFEFLNCAVLYLQPRCHLYTVL